MLDKFSKAFGILADNLPLFLSIQLIALPVTIGFEFSVGADPEALPFAHWSWLAPSILVNVLIVGAVYAALKDLEQNNRASLVNSLKASLSTYIALLMAMLCVGLIVGVGFVAFVIPGIYFALRFSLVFLVVVLEGLPLSASLERSHELMQGRKLELLACWILFVIGFVFLNLALFLFATLFSLDDSLWTQVAISFVGQVVAIAIQIVVFLFYLEAISESSEAHSGFSGDGKADTSPQDADNGRFDA